jgi:hypothetical protein
VTLGVSCRVYHAFLHLAHQVHIRFRLPPTNTADPERDFLSFEMSSITAAEITAILTRLDNGVRQGLQSGTIGDVMAAQDAELVSDFT